MKIKMKKTAIKDILKTYRAGFTYDIDEKTAEIFVKAGLAVIVEEEEEKTPKKKKAKKDEI